MTKEKQLIAIAELDGLLFRTKGKVIFQRWDAQVKGVFQQVKFEDGSIRPCYIENLPPYLTSRDAIIPVIEKVRENDNQFSFIELFDELYKLNKRPTDCECDKHVAIHILLATPSQLAEALLRATNKWEE